MGWFWNRKKKKEVSCDHKYKDFPWHINSIYYMDTKKFHLEIIEPYVCVKCKNRINKVLFSHERARLSYEEGSEIVKNYEEKYSDHIKDEVIVEDMIADMQLVDREYLRLIDEYYNPPEQEIEKEIAALSKELELEIMNKAIAATG